METITSLMDKQHIELFNLLEEFLKDFKKNPFESGAILEKFKWALEKHFFIEEMAIFNTYQEMHSENVSASFELLKEHQIMLALLEKIQNELGDKVVEDVKELENQIKAHQKFEDDNFYPQLDDELNENQKIAIIAKIKEHIR